MSPRELLDTVVVFCWLPFLMDAQLDVVFPVSASVGRFKKVIGVEHIEERVLWFSCPTRVCPSGLCVGVDLCVCVSVHL